MPVSQPEQCQFCDDVGWCRQVLIGDCFFWQCVGGCTGKRYRRHRLRQLVNAVGCTDRVDGRPTGQRTPPGMTTFDPLTGSWTTLADDADLRDTVELGTEPEGDTEDGLRAHLIDLLDSAVHPVTCEQHHNHDRAECTCLIGAVRRTLDIDSPTGERRDDAFDAARLDQALADATVTRAVAAERERIARAIELIEEFCKDYTFETGEVVISRDVAARVARSGLARRALATHRSCKDSREEAL